MNEDNADGDLDWKDDEWECSGTVGTTMDTSGGKDEEGGVGLDNMIRDNSGGDL